MRGVAFQIAEELGVLERGRVAKEIKSFSQEDRAALRKLGVRFGAYHLYLPLLLKPAPRASPRCCGRCAMAGWKTSRGWRKLRISPLRAAPPFAAGSRHRQRVLSRGGLSSLRRARGARRYSRTPRRSYPSRHSLQTGRQLGEPPTGAADADGFVVTVAMTSLTLAARASLLLDSRALG